MKRAAYPKYKESGVPWLGEVPEGWEVMGLRYVCHLAYGGSLAAEGREEGEVGVYGSNGQVGTHIFANTQAPVIVVGRKGSFGKLNYSQTPVFAIDTTYFIDATCTKNNLRWLNYVLLPLRLDETSKDSAVPGLAREDAYQNKVPVPSPKEQTAIADFLDRETGRIDTLVAKKRALLGLLKEKRSSLISCTVTRGLPDSVAREFGLEPHTRFKDSGIEWLGDVPEGWKVAQLRRICTILDCKHKTVSFINDGIPLASIREVNGFEVNLTNAKTTTEEEYLELIEGDRRPSLGDIIYCRNVSVGDAAIVTTTERFSMGQDVCLIRGSHHFPRYLLYQFRSIPLIQQVESLMIGSTFRRINVGQIKAFWVCFPSIPEQTAIAAYLDRETAKLDKLIEKVEAAITRLQEYRTALITAAVTGKIDVRSHRPTDIKKVC